MSQTPTSPNPTGGTPAGGETSTNAIISLVVSIVAYFTCFLLGIVGIIMGNKAKEEIAASNGRLQGEGLAQAGVILGWIIVILGALSILIVLLIILLGGGIAAFGMSGASQGAP